jgi:uncharacterized membrane protein (UPF0127 family)
MAALTLVLAACGGGAHSRDASPTPMPTSSAGLATTQVRVGGRTVEVEMAATPQQREHGLSDRPSLPADAGMLFDMGQVTSAVFWMKDMHFPLDFVWIDAERKVVGVTKDAPPQAGVPDSELTLYRPPSPVRWVLEVNAGAAERLGFATGGQLAFDLPAATPTAAR